MKNFLRRLKYYGVGFGIGLIFVLVFFQNRGCSWLPDNRVKDAVLSRVIVVPADQAKSLDEKGIDASVIMDHLENGDVEFGNSEKSGPDKRYMISLDGQPDLHFTLPGESFVSAVYLNPPADVSARSGKAKMIHFPPTNELIYLDSTETLSCQMEALHWTESDILEAMKKSGYLDFDKSSFSEVVKPIHYIELINANDTLGIESLWYKEKINVTAIIKPGLGNCD